MSDPRDKTNLTASDDNVPFGGSGSPSPIKIGATSHFSAHTAGGDLLGELSAHERMLQEYEWAATFRGNAHDLVVPAQVPSMLEIAFDRAIVVVREREDG